MPAIHSVPPPITAHPALQIRTTNDKHRQRRIFVGPMPEHVVADRETQTRQEAKNKRGWYGLHGHARHHGEQDLVADVVQDYAYQFYVDRGGREEDWTEQEERRITDAMLKRWRETPWGARWSGRHGDPGVKGHWIGDSFEVGDILGVNILQGEPLRGTKSISTTNLRPNGATRDTYTTARSHVSAAPSSARDSSEAPETEVSESSELGPATNEILHRCNDLPEPSSSTELLRPTLTVRAGEHPAKTHSEDPRPVLKDALSAQPQSDGAIRGVRFTSFRRDKGKARAMDKTVHYVESPTTPAPPSDVLERTGSQMAGTSAGAAEAQIAEISSPPALQQSVVPDEIIMQDRMIVRVSYSPEESLGNHFDEVQNRYTHHLRYEDWAEFMVVWRGNRLELYEDYTFPCKEWVTGHKHLAFVAPLDPPRTKVSLYAFTDLTFSLLCEPTPVRQVSKNRWHFHRSKRGTNIFVFKPKCRSRAVDWLYPLWRRLGGELPHFVEVRSPALDTIVRIDCLAHREEGDPTAAQSVCPDDMRAYGIFNRDNLIRLCTKTLSGMRDWEVIMQRRLDEGAELQLAWRFEAELDWVWCLDDIDGKSRDWAVLAGLALTQGEKLPHLEIRVGEHFPTHLHLRDGTHLYEPPGIEGYLDRIKPAAPARHSVYLSTHDGLLFTLSPGHCHPPHPPSSIPPPPTDGEHGDFYHSLRNQEIRRGAAQISSAHSIMDLRSILVVRRAFHVEPRMQEHVESTQEAPWEDSEHEPVERVLEDEHDTGGEEGLSRMGGDRSHKRVRRCFEIVTKTGRILRYEAYSAKVAIEWIERLRSLVRYWKKRHFVDTRLEMDVVHFALDRPQITPHRRWHEEEKLVPPEPPPDPNAILPSLSSMYNWCVMDGCRPITKSARLYARRGLHGMYRLTQLFLVCGHLLQYDVKAGHVQHHRRGKVVNLLDAYTVSGVFAAQSLPLGQYNPNEPPTARRYQDGLECNDPEEDMLFIVYYFPHSPGAGQKAGTHAAIPKLSASRKMLVFRTRSRAERDVWCWALNTEIEKITRTAREREQKLRHDGDLVQT